MSGGEGETWKDLLAYEEQKGFQPPHWFSVVVEVTLIIAVGILAVLFRFTYAELYNNQDYMTLCKEPLVFSFQHPRLPDDYSECFYLFSLLPALILVLLFEFERSYHSTNPNYLHFTSTQKFLYISLRPLGLFILGVLLTSVTVDFLKVQTAWPRPYFFLKHPEICVPSHTFNSSELTKDERNGLMSFPSHLTAITGFCSALCATYTHHSSVLRSAPITKPTLKAVLFLLAIGSAIYKTNVQANHWTDVTTGLGIGAVFGYATNLILLQGYAKHQKPKASDEAWKLLLPRVTLPKQCLAGSNRSDTDGTGSLVMKMNARRGVARSISQQPQWTTN